MRRSVIQPFPFMWGSERERVFGAGQNLMQVPFIVTFPNHMTISIGLGRKKRPKPFGLEESKKRPSGWMHQKKPLQRMT